MYRYEKWGGFLGGGKQDNKNRLAKVGGVGKWLGTISTPNQDIGCWPLMDSGHNNFLGNDQ